MHLGPGPAVDAVHALSLRAALLAGERPEITEPGESEDFGLLLETSEELIPAREFGRILRGLGERGLLGARSTPSSSRARRPPVSTSAPPGRARRPPDHGREPRTGGSEDRPMSFQQIHSADWLAHFVRAGYPDVRPLAAGVEGAVYALDDRTVAKAWGRRRATELQPWQAFYTDLAAAGLPFDTPEILRVEEVGGVAVTIERRLHGSPLQARIDPHAAGLAPSVVNTMLEILRALAAVPATAAMRQLPVLDETEPFRSAEDDFPTALTALLERRTARSAALLRRRVPDFDRRYAALRSGLGALDRRPDTVLHGDLFGENVLIDNSGRLTAILDFGFLSGAGDPRFDAAVTAATMNMYGNHAAATTEALTDAFAAHLGHPPPVLRLYRAAYAVATSDAFTADGSDGHFDWCTRQLTSSSTTAALGL